MASLQARHTKDCALGRPWTTFADADNKHGCTCKPMYHLVGRDGGKLIREAAGHNRQSAERALRRRQVDIDEQDYGAIQNRAFDAWADEYLAMKRRGTKASTVDNYGITLSYGKAVFGSRKVRSLRVSDIDRFLEHVRYENARRTPEGKEPRQVSDSTLAKHLRQLGACLEAAVRRGYASTNPVRMMDKGTRPRVQDSEPNYFVDSELARLWPELAERPVYLALCKAAVTTGLRFGELAGLEWSEVDLLARELRVTKEYREGRVTAPKSRRSRRTVDLTAQAAGVLEEWFKESGGEGLVFEREAGGYLSNEYVLRRVLYPALERAGVPRLGERGGARTFHSLRDTFARVALENGAPM